MNNNKSKINIGKVKQFESERDAWIDSLLYEKTNKFVMSLVAIIQRKMEQGKMNVFYRILHTCLGLLYRLKIDERQNSDMALAGKGGFRTNKIFIKSVTVKVTLNRKILGEKEFALGIYLS